MQASPVWTPPNGTLGGIVAEARAARCRSPRSEAELHRRGAEARRPLPVVCRRASRADMSP